MVLYYRVPMANGILDIDYETLIESCTLNLTEAVVMLLDTAQERATWKKIDELTFLSAFKAGKVTADKPVIVAGLDTATITAEVHPDLPEITFCHADTGEPITTVPVDPATHTATLQVTATTPGVVRIRAGEPTMTKLNEAVIIAQ